MTPALSFETIPKPLQCDKDQWPGIFFFIFLSVLFFFTTGTDFQVCTAASSDSLWHNDLHMLEPMYDLVVELCSFFLCAPQSEFYFQAKCWMFPNPTFFTLILKNTTCCIWLYHITKTQTYILKRYRKEVLLYFMAHEFPHQRKLFFFHLLPFSLNALQYFSRNSESDSCSAEELSSIPWEHGGAQGLPVRHDQTVQ